MPRLRNSFSVRPLSPREIDVAHARGIARGHLEIEVDQRIFSVEHGSRRNLATVISVVLQCRVHAWNGKGCFISGVSRAWLQLGSTLKHRGKPIVLDAIYIDPPNKKARRAREHKGQTIPGPNSGHFDCLVKAGGVQAAEAGSYLGWVKSHTRLLG